MNKKGEIPITILVLGIVMVCILAIVSFYTSSANVKNNFDIQIVKEAKLIAEKTELYSNLGLSQEQIDDILGIKNVNGERYILLEREGISVKYYLLR